jgi:hypothetical protein
VQLDYICTQRKIGNSFACYFVGYMQASWACWQRASRIALSVALPETPTNPTLARELRGRRRRPQMLPSTAIEDHGGLGQGFPGERRGAGADAEWKLETAADGGRGPCTAPVRPKGRGKSGTSLVYLRFLLFCLLIQLRHFYLARIDFLCI